MVFMQLFALGIIIIINTSFLEYSERLVFQGVSVWKPLTNET